MLRLQDSVYLFENNLDRFRYVERGTGYDLQAFSFDGMVEIDRVAQNQPLKLPEPTFFYLYHKDSNYLNRIDSFQTLEGCPIFSQKMIDVLLSVSEFSYRRYPIAVLEDGENLDPYEDIEKYKKLSLRNDLFIFQTLEFLDVFDWEKSEYEQDEYDKEDNIPSYIRQFVLKTPSSGFPPLFRLPFKSSNLFISTEARQALKNAEIVGTEFTPLLRPRGNSEIDVPIQEIPNPQLDLRLEKRQKMIVTVFERAKEERLKGNTAIADRLEQKAHDLMRE